MTLDCYTLTWEELLAVAEARRDAVVSLEGYLMCSPDRKLDVRSAESTYKTSVARAIARGHEVPDHVRAEYEARIVANGIAPDHAKRAAHDTLPLKTALVNAKGKPFSWSPSAISDYITCPAQYAARRFYETLPYVETEAMKQGTIEHKHLEDRLKFKKPLPKGYTRGEKKCQALERMVAGGGDLIAEQDLAIDEDMKFVSWFDKKAWGRCKIDVTAVTLPRIFVGDWKTGKVKDDLLQLKINACFLALKYPDAEEFITRFFWLKFDEVTPTDGSGNFKATQIPDLWAEILGWVERMKQSWQTESFQPRSSGLCREYCAVTSCPHCGKGGR